MPTKDKQSILRKLAIFLILATVFEFSNLGSVIIEEAGEVLRAPALKQIAGNLKINKAQAAGNAVIFITSTASTTWVVPGDWNSASNTIEVIGGGGGGNKGNATTNAGGGGGGGAYAKKSNLSLTPSSTVTIQVGAGGAATATGTDTWFNSSTCAAASACAKGGSPGIVAGAGGAGGASSTSVGTTIFAGGIGGTQGGTSGSAGGGGGAAGPNGLGNYTSANTTTTGGSADAGFGGAGGAPNAPGSPGGNGTEWSTSPAYGSGGGGGSSGAGGTGATGGNYGGGGGGAGRSTGTGGAGKQGIIVITYTPTTPTTSPGTPTYASVAATTLTVNWTAATSSINYDLQRSTDGNSFSHIATTTVLTYNDSGLSASTVYYYKVRGQNSTGDAGPYSASSSVTTLVAPADATSVTYTVGADGARSGDAITITGTSFGTVSAGSRATCGGGTNTGCIHFDVGGTSTVADADVTAWSATSITFNVSTTLATLGGTSTLKVYAAGTGDATPLNFFVYPKVTGMAVCTDCNANSAREYNSGDTDGIIYLSGDHFGTASGTVWLSGNNGFGNVTSTIHTVAEGPCTTSGWGGTTSTNSTACLEVPATIADNMYSGNVSLQRDDASGTIVAWGATTALPTSLANQRAVVWNGYVYSMGGGTGNGTSTVNYAPISSTGSIGAWTNTTALPAAVLAQSAVVWNGYVYSIGGTDIGGGSTSTVYYASINSTGSLGAWTATTVLPTSTRWGPSFAWNGYVYLMGGISLGWTTSTVRYAPINATGSLGAWADTTALPTSTQSMAVVAWNGYVYSMGGYLTGLAVTSTVNYAPINSTGSLGAWATTTNLPTSTTSWPAVALNGYIYSIGGYNGAVSTSTVNYAPINSTGSLGAWVTAAALPAATYAEPAVAWNGYVYSMGGSPGPTSTVNYAPIGKTDNISLRVLPRIISNNPTVASSGVVVDITGNHFCQTLATSSTSGVCPVSPNRSSTTDNVKFGSTTSTDADFQDLTGGAGLCNGTGASWTNTEICVKVPAGTTNTSNFLGSWVTTTALPTSTYYQTSVVNNGYVYAIGGAAGGIFTSTVRFASINSTGSIGAWTETTALPAATYNHSSIVNNGYVYVIGGRDTSSATTTVRFALINSTGSLGAWTETTILPETTANHSSIVNNGYVYAIGGTVGGFLSPTVRFAQINSTGSIGTWTNTTALPKATTDHSSVVNNGYVYEIGGSESAGNTSTVRYALINSTGSLGVWTDTTVLPKAKRMHSSIVNNGYVYVIGGNDTSAGAIASDVVSYALINGNGSLGTWQNATKLPAAMYNHSSVANNGYVYSIGGRDAGNIATTTVNYAPLLSAPTQITSNSYISNKKYFNVASSTPVPPDATSVTYTVGSDGARSGDSITITGNTFGTVSAGSRANCSGGAGTGCVKFIVGGYATVADADITAWSTTSITFNVSSTLTTLGGAASLQVCGAGLCDSTPLTFFVYPKVTGMAVCTGCNANAGREYNASDTDGIIMLNGDHFGSTAGSIYFTGTFNGVTSTIHGNGTVNSPWAGTAALPTSTYNQPAVVNNGYVYTIGGKSGGITSTVNYATINSTGSLGAWATTTALPAATYNQPAVVNNGYVYSIGGWDGTAATATVNYAPINSTGSLGAWATTTKLPSAIYVQPAVVNNGYVYSIGGYDGTAATTTVNYAPINSTGSLGAWATTTKLPSAMYQQPSVVNNGYVYSIGGFGTNGVTSTVNYAPINSTGSLGAWATTTALPAATYGQPAVVINGYVYTIGGNSGGATSTIFYAPINSNGTLGAWSTTTALPSSTYSQPAVAWNGYIYSIGGFGGTAATATVNYAQINGADGACTVGGWGGSAGASNTACLEVPATIADNMYTGNVSLQRDDASSTIVAWGTTTALPSSTSNQPTVAWNGYIYSIGGNSGGATSTVNYAPINATGSLGVWSTTTALPKAMYYQPAVAWNGYIYSIGGFGGTAATATVNYAPINSTGSLGSWTTTTALPAATYAHPAVAWNGYIYSIGGFSGGVTSTVNYAPINSTGSLGSWTTTTALPSSTYAHPAVAWNGYIYSIGGFGTAATATVNYAPINSTGSLGSWTTTTALPAATYYHPAVAWNGYIYSIGGYSGTVTSTVNYAPINSTGSLGSWTTTTALPAATYAHPAVAWNGNVYSIGGIGSVTTATVNYAPISKTDNISLRVLPRILSNNPVSTSTGNVVDITGNHFCEFLATSSPMGVCPVSPNRAASTDNVKFGSTTSTDSDFQDLTGGAGLCNGTGAAWTNTEVCVKVPAATPAGSASTTITSNTLYQSNKKDFNVSSTASTIPNSPSNLAQFTGDGVTTINVGSSTATTTVTLKADISATLSINMALQIEAQAVGTSFTNVPTASGTVSGGGACTSCTSLTTAKVTSTLTSTGDAGTNYHWQARAINTTDNSTSSWVSFGGNPEANTDFNLDVTAPVITSLATSSVSTSTAAITWNTSGESADSRVQYGTSTLGTIGAWAQTTVLPTSTYSHSSVVNNGYVYEIGGIAAVFTAVTTTVRYAQINSTGSLGAWTNATALLGPTYSHSSVVNNGYVYEIGGADQNDVTSTVSFASINSTGSLGAWTSTTVLPWATYEHSSIVNNGYVYMIGGIPAGTSAATTTVRYALINSTGSLGAWTDTTALSNPSSTYNHSSVVNNGYVYVIGGGNGSDTTTTVRFALINSTGSLGTWTNTTVLPAARNRHASVIYKGYIYVLGGIDSGGFGASTVYYAPINSTGSLGAWTTTTDLPAVIYNQSSIVNNGYVYDIGGLRAGVATTTVNYAPIDIFAASCATNNDCTSVTDAVPPGTNSHSVGLTSLSTSTFYYFRARSKDAASNESTSSVSNFTTTSSSGSGLPATGQVTSIIFDTTGSSNGPGYNSILWKGTAGTGKVRFRFATSNTTSGPWTDSDFFGSNDGGVTCNASSWYAPSGSNVPVELSCAPQKHNNQRYFRYLIQLCSNSDCSTAGATSPVVSSTVVSWSP